MARKKKVEGDSWRIYSYDVWGNADDGYEVNNKFKTAYTAHFDAEDSDEEILTALVDCGYIAARFSTDDVEFEDGGDGVIFVNDAKDGRPICELVFGE